MLGLKVCAATAQLKIIFLILAMSSHLFFSISLVSFAGANLYALIDTKVTSVSCLSYKLEYNFPIPGNLPYSPLFLYINFSLAV